MDINVGQVLDSSEFSFEFLDDIKKPDQQAFNATEYIYQNSTETKVNLPIKQIPPKQSHQLKELSQRIANVDSLVRKIKELEVEKANFNIEKKILSQNSLEIKKLYEEEKLSHRKIREELNELKSQFEHLDNEHTNKTLQFDQFQAKLESQTGPIPYSELALRYIVLVQNSDNTRKENAIVDKLHQYCKENKIVVPKKAKNKCARSPCKTSGRKDNGTQCEVTKETADRGTQYIMTTTTRGVNTDKVEDTLINYIGDIMSWERRSPISPIIDPPEVSSIQNTESTSNSKELRNAQDPGKTTIPPVQIKLSDSRPPSSMMFETLKEDSSGIFSGSGTPLNAMPSAEPHFTINDFTNLWQVFGNIVCSLLLKRNSPQQQFDFIPNQCDILGQQDFFLHMLGLYHGLQQGCSTEASSKDSPSFNSSSAHNVFRTRSKRVKKHRDCTNFVKECSTPSAFYQPKPHYKCATSNSDTQTMSMESAQLDNEVSGFLSSEDSSYTKLLSMEKPIDGICLEKLKRKSTRKKSKGKKMENDDENTRQACSMNNPSLKISAETDTFKIPHFSEHISVKKNPISNSKIKSPSKEATTKMSMSSEKQLQNEENPFIMPKSSDTSLPKKKRKVSKRVPKTPEECPNDVAFEREKLSSECDSNREHNTDSSHDNTHIVTNIIHPVNQLPIAPSLPDLNGFDLLCDKSKDSLGNTSSSKKAHLSELFGSESEDDEVSEELLPNVKELICDENSSSSNFSAVTVDISKSEVNANVINDSETVSNVNVNSLNAMRITSDGLASKGVASSESEIVASLPSALSNEIDEMKADSEKETCESNLTKETQSNILEDLHLSDTDCEDTMEDVLEVSKTIETPLITAVNEENANPEKLDFTLDLTVQLFDSENNVILPSPNTSLSSAEDREKDENAKDELLTDIIKDIEMASDIIEVPESQVHDNETKGSATCEKDVELIGEEIVTVPQDTSVKAENELGKSSSVTESQNTAKKSPKRQYIVQRTKGRLVKIQSVRAIPTKATLCRMKSKSSITSIETKESDETTSAVNGSQTAANSGLDELGEEDNHSIATDNEFPEEDKSIEMSSSSKDFTVEKTASEGSEESCQELLVNLAGSDNEDSMDERLVIDEQGDETCTTGVCGTETQLQRNVHDSQLIGSYENQIWKDESLNSYASSSQTSNESSLSSTNSELSSSNLSSAEGNNKLTALSGKRRGRKRKSEIELPAVCKRSARLLAKLHVRTDDSDEVAKDQMNSNTNFKRFDLENKFPKELPDESSTDGNEAAEAETIAPEAPIIVSDEVCMDNAVYDPYESPASPPSTTESCESTESTTAIVQIPLDAEKFFDHQEGTTFMHELLKCHGMYKSKNIFNGTVSKSNAKILESLKEAIAEYLRAEPILNCSIDALEFIRKLKRISSDYELIIAAIVSQMKDVPRPEIEMSCEVNKLPPKTLSTSHRRIAHVLSTLATTESEDYTSGFLAHIDSILFTVSNAEKQSLEEAMNLTQLYLLILSNEMLRMTNSPARLFIAKCLYFHNLKALPMINEVLTVFPTVLPHREERSYDRSDPLISVIQHIMMCYVYDMNNEDLRCKELLSKLRYEYHFEPFRPTQDEVLQNLMAKFEANKLTNLTYAFALLCKRYTPKRTTIQVLQPHLLPLANNYYQLSLKSPDYDDRIAALLDCISMVIKPFPIEMNIDSYITIFSRFLHAVERPAVQEAALQAILRTQRFGYANCFNALQNFNPTYQLSNQTKAMLRTFIHRKPLKFWKSLIRNASVGATKRK